MIYTTVDRILGLGLQIPGPGIPDDFGGNLNPGNSRKFLYLIYIDANMIFCCNYGFVWL